MSSRQFKITLMSLVAGACCCAALSFGMLGKTESPPVEKLLPANAALYVGWDGRDLHRANYEKTAAYDAYEKSGLSGVLDKLVAFAATQGGLDPKQVSQALNRVAGSGASFVVTIPQEGPPLPHAVLVLHHAADIEPFLRSVATRAAGKEVQFVTRSVESRTVTSAVIPRSPDVEIGWWIEGDHVVVTAGIGAIEAAAAVAAGRAPNITQDALWKKYRVAPAEFEVTSVSWFDLGGLRRRFADIVIPASDPMGPEVKVGQVAEALGLGTIGALVNYSGFQGRALRSHSILEDAAPTTGLLDFRDVKPMTLADLPPLPAATPGFYARRLDLSRTFDSLVETAKRLQALFQPAGAPDIDTLRAQMNQALGFDLKTQLLDPLGDTICAYNDPGQSAFFGLGVGIGIAIKVDDAKTLKATIETLLEKLAADFQVTATVRKTMKHGREVFSIDFAPVPIAPAFVVDKDWLVIGLSAQSVETFLLRQDGRLPRWKPSEEYEAAFKELPAQFISISTADPRIAIRGLLGFAPAMLALTTGQLSRERPDMQFPISAADLPAPELVTQSLFPNVSVCMVDDTGMHWKSRLSMPSIPIVGGMSSGGSGVAVAATLTGLLLPAVQQAREAARRSQSKNNLKQIGLALHNFHDQHNAFPAGTHPNKDLKPEKRLSWMVDLLPLIDQAALFKEINLDKAWDDEANKAALETQLEVFHVPGMQDDGDAKLPTTHYVGIAGVGKNAPTLPVTDKRGAFGYDRALRLRDVPDGTSNTIAVSEARAKHGPWGAGGNATIRALVEKPYINGPDGIGSSFEGGCNFLLLDGAVRFISENIDPALMEKLATINGGEAAGGL